MNDVFVALYSYKYRPSEDAEEVSFESGDLFYLRDSSHGEWWLVSPLLQNDIEFYVPANYIEAKNNVSDSARQIRLSEENDLSPTKNSQVRFSDGVSPDRF